MSFKTDNVTFLTFLESLALLVVAWFLWRRTRAAVPSYGRCFAFLTLALVLQLGLLLSANLLFDWLEVGSIPVDRLTRAALGISAIQFLRTLLLAWAVHSWLLVVKPRLVRSWRGVLLLICLIFITFIPAATLGFAVLMIVPLMRLKWTEHIHGWSRAGWVIVLGILSLALTADVNVTMSVGELGEASTSFASSRSLTLLDGDLPQPAAAIVNLLRPCGHAIRVMLILLHLQVAVGFFQLLVLPIRLRGLSLKRRFTVTLAMYRFIPGTLAFIFMILIVYLGIGLHRANVVRRTFDQTLYEGMRTAVLLASRAASQAYDESDATQLMRLDDPWAINPSDRAYAVVRQLEWTLVERDNTTDDDQSPDAHWVARAGAASSGTPDAILDGNFFADVSGDSTVGLVEKDGTLYLRSAYVRRMGDRGTGSEVFVALDSSYLARIADGIQSDIRVDVSPTLFIGESTVSIGSTSDGAWADSTFTVEAPFVRHNKLDFWERKFYLARTFVPVGDWLQSTGGGQRIGAVQLKLYTSPRGLFESLTNSSLVIASQAFAIIIFIVIGVLFLFVELSAVRTGRSIIKGIVTDVKSLSEAAKKFGQGDLQHRVALSGEDEMGQLAATFNTMASNIEQHQEVLLEKERLEADLALARDIQQRMLPQDAPTIPGLDVAGLSIPSREVGGDLFYFLPVANGRLGLTIGDVSGKSVPAALLMSNVLAALKSEARIVDKEDEILDHLNRLIIDQVEPGRFVTFFYGVVDRDQRTIRYACAGHNPPLLMRRTGEAGWLEEAGVPLGVMLDSTYAPVEAALREGDVLVLYSDGVTEAQRPAEAKENDDASPPSKDEFFDEHRLETAVREARDKSATDIIGQVMDAIQKFTEGAEQSDDLTLVVVRVVPYQDRG